MSVVRSGCEEVGVSAGEWLAIVFLVGLIAYFGGLLMGAALADGARADADAERMERERKK